jgi:hypothetical protein
MKYLNHGFTRMNTDGEQTQPSVCIGVHLWFV